MVDNPEKYELLVSKATYWSEIKFKVGLFCKVKSILILIWYLKYLKSATLAIEFFKAILNKKQPNMLNAITK